MPEKSIARQITIFSREEIKKLFATAQVVYKQNGLEIRSAPSTGKIGRILIVVPRTAGNAVKRNVFKRRVKAIFYQEKGYAHGYDYVVLVKKEAIDLSFQELKQIFVSLFHNENH